MKGKKGLGGIEFVVSIVVVISVAFTISVLVASRFGGDKVVDSGRDAKDAALDAVRGLTNPEVVKLSYDADYDMGIPYIYPASTNADWNRDSCPFVEGPAERARNIAFIAGSAKSKGIDPRFALAIIAVETGGKYTHCKGINQVLINPNDQDTGIGQIIPSTARTFCSRLDILKVQQNIECSTNVMVGKRQETPDKASYEAKVKEFCKDNERYKEFLLAFSDDQFSREAKAYNGFGCDVSYLQKFHEYLRDEPWKTYINQPIQSVVV